VFENQDDLMEPSYEILGIIGGSNLLASTYFSSSQRKIVSTEFGDVVLYFGHNFIFCQRHQANPKKDYCPPHLINKKAIISAFLASNVSKVIAFGSVGSLKPELKLGTLIFPDDFFNLWDNISFFEDKRGHVVPSLESEFRTELIQAVQSVELSTTVVTTGTYVQTTGPRFETKSEIKFLKDYCDVVGMTAAHEATLCGEVKLPYVLICIVDNMAHGITTGLKLTLEEFHRGLKQNEKLVETLLTILMTKYART